jgi:hypothetical protein
MLPRSAKVEKKDFDVDIELIRVDGYALHGLVYHYILGERDLTFSWSIRDTEETDLRYQLGMFYKKWRLPSRCMFKSL